MKSFLALLFVVIAVQANEKVGDYVPVAFKKHLPVKVLEHLNKLEPKDLKAAERIASRWHEFKSVQQFEKTLRIESAPLKKFIDSTIKAGHESLDKLVDKMHPETIEMAQQKAKNNLRELFPKTSYALSHQHAQIAAVSYCGLLNGLFGGNNNGGLGAGLGAFLNGNGLGGIGGNLGGNLGANFGLRGASNRRSLGRGWLRLYG
ncbi:hypothetical protein M3Y97_00649300 [Aphelenchoides bicaudatus]|nr:hypothetical protein M3Y97_00649300 [Aphelenchoides bicaudatus]